MESIKYHVDYYGLVISLSTLQDTTKTQNKFSKKIWQNPTKAKSFLIGLSASILFTIGVGLFFYFKTDDSALKEVSIGLIVFAIGLIGILKSAIEMFENHRMDKNETA